MIKLLVSFALLATAVQPSIGQQHRPDPLSNGEVDQLRDAAQEPAVRLKLYVGFARTRLERLQQIRTDSQVTDKEQETRSTLQDFIDIFDELDENVDNFADRGDDLRKAIKPVIEADTEFGSRLRAFKLSLESSRDESEKYDFLIGSALEAVDNAAKDHRNLLAEQEEKFKNKKNKPHKESRGE